MPSHRRAFWAPFGSWPRSSPWQCSAHPGRSAHPPPGTEQCPGKGCPFPPSGLQCTTTHGPSSGQVPRPLQQQHPGLKAPWPRFQGGKCSAAQGTNGPGLLPPTQKPRSCCPGSCHEMLQTHPCAQASLATHLSSHGSGWKGLQNHLVPSWLRMPAGHGPKTPRHLPYNRETLGFSHPTTPLRGQAPQDAAATSAPLTHQHSCALGDELGGDGELRAVHVRLQPVQLRVPAHPPAEAEGKAQGVLPAGGRGGCTISLGSNPPAPDPTEKTCLENSKGETPALPLHDRAKRKRARKVFSGCSGGFYLLVKVVVESNQVEIAFEALQSPLEEILFGAAPLEAKETEPVMLSADQSCIPQQTRRLGKKPYRSFG